MQKIRVYLKHRASNSSDFWREKISSALFRSEVVFRSPENLRQLKLFLEEDIALSPQSIISVGGDGTVNTLIQDLAYTGIGLLVIPGGTANDLANELGNLRNVKRVIHCIRSKEYYNIDLIKINNRYMATNGGIGLGSRVAEKMNLIRTEHPYFKFLMKMTGKRIYSLFLGRELLSMRHRPTHFLIESLEFSKIVNAPIVLINNQAILAGTFNIAPETNNADGKFNVTIFCHPNKKLLVQSILGVMKGKVPKDDPYFISFETDHVYIENLSKEKNVQFFGDGEIIEEGQSYDIRIAKEALKVYSHKRACLTVEENYDVEGTLNFDEINDSNSEIL